MSSEYGGTADASAAPNAAARDSAGSSTQKTPLNGAASRPGTEGQQGTSNKVQQPKPQALPARAGPTSILVSPRQKGNPVLSNIRQMPWEYSDIPADYVLGATTCALFLSLTYHRLHPEYVYNRIRGLQHKYNLRILLTMVDIENHEEPLKELSKTSLINNVTLILCWSAQEAGRYLELFKSYEHAAPTSIRAHQSTTYSDKLVEFITVPRSINKTDAVSLVSTFGSVRTAVNAEPEEIALVAGWGGKKVQRWCSTVREPFRVKKAARRGIARDASRAGVAAEAAQAVEDDTVTPATHLNSTSALPRASSPNQGLDSDSNSVLNVLGNNTIRDHAVDPERDPKQAHLMGSVAQPHADSLSEGIASALERLRRQ